MSAVLWKIRNAVSLILFGSRARGDADESSDFDYCAFTEDCDFENLLELREDLARELGVPVESVATYPKAVVDHMVSRGSLFFEHIKREGKILHDPSGFASAALARLMPFEDYARELDLYQALLGQITAYFLSWGEVTAFDLHVLHGVVRDACIMLTYHAGDPVFGRSSAFYHARSLYPGLPVGEEDFDLLARGHLTYLRGGSPALGEGSQGSSVLESNRVKDLLSSVADLLVFCEEAVS